MIFTICIICLHAAEPLVLFYNKVVIIFYISRVATFASPPIQFLEPPYSVFGAPLFYYSMPRLVCQDKKLVGCFENVDCYPVVSIFARSAK